MINTSTHLRKYSHRSEMKPLLPEHYSRVLEIGCGEGKFRANLFRRHEYWGVEPVESAAKIASTKLDKVLIGTYQETINQIPNHYFDLIICNDVIEHMPDHDHFLQSIKGKITEEGYLVASIPNVRYLPNLFEIIVKKDWNYRNEGILDRTHLRFFTKKSLLRTINGNGFIVDHFVGINPYRGCSILKSSLSYVAIIILGQDVQFSQFGIRLKQS